MNISELCIRRPVMTTLVMLSFVIFGAFAFRQLPVAALPNVDFPTISVYASLPGASAETMASSVAAPLERQFATISGVSSMTSSSSIGATQIVLQFSLDRNIDGAALDVQSAISTAARKLPPELPQPPSFSKVNPGDFAVLFLSLTSATLPLTTVNDYAETVLQQQISQLPGVVAGADFRHPALRRAHPCRSGRRGGARLDARRCEECRLGRELQHAGRRDAGRQAAHHARDRRTIAACGGLFEHRDRGPQRAADPLARCRGRRRRHRKRSERRLVRQHPSRFKSRSIVNRMPTRSMWSTRSRTTSAPIGRSFLRR